MKEKASYVFPNIERIIIINKDSIFNIYYILQCIVLLY
jgi:hypothetical protein